MNCHSKLGVTQDKHLRHASQKFSSSLRNCFSWASFSCALLTRVGTFLAADEEETTAHTRQGQVRASELSNHGNSCHSNKRQQIPGSLPSGMAGISLTLCGTVLSTGNSEPETDNNGHPKTSLSEQSRVHGSTP